MQYPWGRDYRIFSSIKRATELVADDYLEVIKWFGLQWTSQISLVSHMHSISNMKVRMKANIRNRYNQIPHLTKYTIWESHKNTINITYKKSALSQCSGDHKAAWNRQDNMKNTHKTQITTQRSTKEAPSWNGQQ